MSMLEGISQCWPLGTKCHVWWDAWAVGVAVVAVAATVFLGIATLRLGKRANELGRTSIQLGEDANRAAALAVEIASEEAKHRAAVSHTQRLLVLLQIRAEVGLAHQVFADTVLKLSRDGSKASFDSDPNYRMTIRKTLFWQRFETAKALGDRMHHVGHPVAGHLALVIGLVDHWAQAFASPQAQGAVLTGNDWEETKNIANLLSRHLAPVNAACGAAALEAGVESRSAGKSKI